MAFQVGVFRLAPKRIARMMTIPNA
jgi:hypothetical protein